MTVWDNIYQDYKQGGEAYATLQKGLLPEFLAFIKSQAFQAKRVLDIGCGTGTYLAFLKTLGFKADGVDSSPTAVEMAQKVLGDDSDIRCLDMYDYNPPANKYDLIISIGAIHHGLKKPVRALIKRLYPALLPHGRVFIKQTHKERSAHWTMMTDAEEIEPGTRVPLSGPKKGLPHSAFTREEIEDLFSEYQTINMQLLADHQGDWLVTGEK
jgi:cyclopropane fatty-acyl-phospholipid synthase-like methyltransferase